MGSILAWFAYYGFQRSPGVMLQHEINAAKKRCEEATGGTWVAVGKQVRLVQRVDCVHSDNGVCNCLDRYNEGRGERNAAFIAHARIDLPAALSTLERVLEAADALERMGDPRRMGSGDLGPDNPDRVALLEAARIIRKAVEG